MRGKISFGDATGTAVNTVNNFWSSGTSTVANMESDITSVGNTVINNEGFFSYSDYSHITQTGLGTVIINNGVAGGYDPATASAVEYNNAVIWGDITTAGSTTLTNALGAALNYDTAGFTLGTNHTGTTTLR